MLAGQLSVSQVKVKVPLARDPGHYPVVWVTTRSAVSQALVTEEVAKDGLKIWLNTSVGEVQNQTRSHKTILTAQRRFLIG